MYSDRANQRNALLVSTIASFLTPFMVSSVVVALPTLGKEFGATAVTLGWVSTAYLLAAAMFLVPIGRLADIYGRKRLFMLGAGIYGLSTLFSGLAPSIEVLIACRALEGLGGAMISGTGVAILTGVYPPQERGRVLGINTAATYLGLSLGPLLGGVLTRYLSWRGVFFAILPLSILIIVLARFRLRGEWAEARGERFDLRGALLYAASLVALMFGFSRLPAPLGLWLVPAGLLGLAAFAWLEARLPSPVLDVNLFRRNPVFALSNLAALLNYCATYAITFLMSLYLQYLKGLPPQTAGLVLVAQPVVQSALSPLAGRLSDRAEPRVLASLGMALNVLGLLLFSLLSAQTPLLLIIGILALEGLGFALFSSPNMHAVMSSVERRFYGVASGTMGTMRLTGQMFSMATAMLAFSLYMGQTQITPAVYPQFLTATRTVFLVFAVLCIGGILASWARGKMHTAHEV